MCGSDIVDGNCSCGIWRSADEMKDNLLKNSIEMFHDMKRFTLTADAPHLGVAVVFFRGDYNDAKEVEKYIHEMKGRPYYDET
jgi:hypothetical protein